jgi:hypothetical protein
MTWRRIAKEMNLQDLPKNWFLYFLDTEEGSSKLFQNVDKHLATYMASYSRMYESS